MNEIQKLITDHIALWSSAEVEKQSSRGRAGGFSEKIYGIQRLRQLILCLASQGRLVPQDADDESAMELYKKIQVERQGLGFNQTINVEPTPGLPTGWIRVPIQSLFKIVYGKGLSNSELTNEGYDVFGANGIIGKYSSYIYEAPQLLISCRGAYSGKPNISPPFCFVTSNSLVLESDWTHLSQSYFYYALSIADKKKIVTGSAQPQVTATNLGPFSILLPPLAEQHRIVAKVDELMALCDKLESATTSSKNIHKKIVESVLDALVSSQSSKELKNIQTKFLDMFDTLFISESSINLLKSALIQLAIQGGLSRKNSSDGSGAELLAKITYERANSSKAFRKRKILPIDVSSLHKIPDNWVWTQNEYISHDWGQKIPTEPFLYIDVSSIDSETGTVSTPEVVLPEDAPSRARKIVKPGSVIYSTVRPYLLNVAIIDQQFDVEPIASTAFVVIHPMTSISAKYIFYYLRSPTFIKYVESVQTGTTYPAINDVQFYSAPFPLPPLAEQYRIVDKLEELLHFCDEMKKLVLRANEHQRKVADAIVEQALA